MPTTANITDLSFDSLQITHRADQTSEARFILPRHFDRPDYTLEGVYSPISNKNAIVIKYKGVTLFTGKVSEINAISNTDTVECICIGYQQFVTKRNFVTIPVSGISSPRYLYDAVLSDVKIRQEKEIRDIEDNPSVGGLLPAGYTATSKTKSSEEEYNGIKIHLGRQRVEYVYFKNGTVLWDDNGNPHDADQYGDPKAEIYDPSNYWDEVFYYNIVVEISPDDSAPYKKTYTWVGGGLPEGRYISAQYFAQTISPLQQRHYDSNTGEWKWVEGIDLGYYYEGSSPYQEISPSTVGTFLSSPKYVVEGEEGQIQEFYSEKLGGERNGIKHVNLIPNLYLVQEPQYDYLGYCERLAYYEYTQLLKKKTNKPGDTGGQTILTSATISVTLDTLLYYSIKLNSAINISNTTQKDIYNNNNGFPLTVKGISISGGDCMVTLDCDNQRTTAQIVNDKTASISYQVSSPIVPLTFGGFKTLIYKGQN